MNKKRMLITLCVVVLACGTLAFSWQAQQATSNNKSAPQQAKSIPDYAVYRQMFHHHIALKEKAQELEGQGKSGKSLRSFYQREANLNDDEARAFDEIASKCEQDVAQQDAKAKAIIDTGLARYPGGKVPQGEKMPEAPAELKALWEERNAIILRARDHLRAAFGEREFQRFEEFVQRNVTPHVTSEPISRQRPASPMGLRQQAR